MLLEQGCAIYPRHHTEASQNRSSTCGILYCSIVFLFTLYYKQFSSPNSEKVLLWHSSVFAQLLVDFMHKERKYGFGRESSKVILCKKMFGAFAEMGTAQGFVILWLVAVKYLYWWCLGSEVCRLFILGHYENYFRRIHCGKTLWQALNCVGPLIKVMRYLS